jgi:hypothetical protein
MSKKRKLPRHVSLRALEVVKIATRQAPEVDPDEGKNPAAIELGRLGGLKGGKARARKSNDERSASAKKAALARWEKRRSG